MVVGDGSDMGAQRVYDPLLGAGTDLRGKQTVERTAAGPTVSAAIGGAIGAGLIDRSIKGGGGPEF